eukprot:TRINITY_DN3155_c0_g3_i7.p1 TRINITY_DN3155_c0_g3~~TRINITY_DN3155_c0_g3_i7.p1  ORF type:complete len:851 (+),score=264.14 TRINITY_DN3155_c0_g3_i7:120-2672(+)
MFRKTLSDMVRGIRSNKKSESKYISDCIQEIKDELKQPDMNVKCQAVQKLSYLQMLGYDISWAAFNVIEVMSQTKFSMKRAGYLAASQSFNENTDVVMLATQLIRKDMTSSNIYEAGIALNCFSNICTPDLAQDLAADVVALMNTSRPFVRKRAVLSLYKIFLKYPGALRPAFPRLKEKLEDPDMVVISCAVNVICELARKNPKNYLSLAPLFYKLLTTSNNNWMLIKIIKLFGALTPLEKRLGKKLAEPLTNILNTTPAMSLLYETIQTCIIGLPENTAVIRLCISKLRSFIEDPDQNLKYLGLLALYNIMKIYPKAVAEYRDLVVWCLDDEDVTIRLRALDLLSGMASKKNLVEIIQKLMERLEKAEGSYRDDLIEKIIGICSQGQGVLYQFVTNFEWYISILIDLAHVHGTKHGKLIAAQLLDVGIRVKSVRPAIVKSMFLLLQDPKIMNEHPEGSTTFEVLESAAWIIGEFIDQIDSTAGVIEALLHPHVFSLPPHVQSVFIQNALKVLAFKARTSGGSQNLVGEPSATSTPNYAEVDVAIQHIQSRLTSFTNSIHIEVQERACFVSNLLNLFTQLRVQGLDIAGELGALFEEPLNPVAPKAQKKVPVPDGLDLDTQINEPPEEESEGEEEDKGHYVGAPIFSTHNLNPAAHVEEESDTEKEEQRKKRIHDRKQNPYFLSDEPILSHHRDDLPQVQNISEDLNLKIQVGSAGTKYPVTEQKSGPVSVNMTLDTPEGAQLNSDESDEEDHDDPLGDVDISSELKPGEGLFRREHRRVVEKAAPKKERKGKKEKKEKKTKKEGKEKKEKKEKKERGKERKEGRGQEGRGTNRGEGQRCQRDKDGGQRE